MRRSRRRGRRCAHGRRVGERRSPSRWDGEDVWLWLRVKKAAADGQRGRYSVPCDTASRFVARSLKLCGMNLNLYDNVHPTRKGRPYPSAYMIGTDRRSV